MGVQQEVHEGERGARMRRVHQDGHTVHPDRASLVGHEVGVLALTLLEVPQEVAAVAVADDGLTADDQLAVLVGVERREATDCVGEDRLGLSQLVD